MRYIKLYEKMTEWEWYDDVATCRVFIHLILTANWKDTRWHGVEIKRGQRIISFRGLAKETNLTERQVRTAIDHLRSTHEVTQQSTHNYTTVTIENYEEYQSCDKTSDTVSDTVSDTAATSDIEAVEHIDIKNTPTVYKKDRANEIVEIYLQECPSLPKVRSLSQTRIAHINARLKEHSIDEIRLAFQKAEASPLMRGEKSGWHADLDWMMESEDHLLRILEGRYDDNNSNKAKALKDLQKIGMTQDEFEEMERRFQ